MINNVFNRHRVLALTRKRASSETTRTMRMATLVVRQRSFIGPESLDSLGQGAKLTIQREIMFAETEKAALAQNVYGK